MGREFLNEDTMDYLNPAALLEVVPPAGEPQLVHALGAETVPVPGITDQAAGYTFSLMGFERSASGHILAVQRDPGVPFIYAGSALLMTALAGVFFFSHRRVWAVIEEKPDGNIGILIAGHANRNTEALEAKIRKIGAIFEDGQS